MLAVLSISVISWYESLESSLLIHGQKLWTVLSLFRSREYFAFVAMNPSTEIVSWRMKSRWWLFHSTVPLWKPQTLLLNINLITQCTVRAVQLDWSVHIHRNLASSFTNFDCTMYHVLNAIQTLNFKVTYSIFSILPLFRSWHFERQHHVPGIPEMHSFSKVLRWSNL